MIGVIGCRLRAEQAGSLSVFSGRLLHGAFFHYLEEISPALSARLHDGNVNPFTLSPLFPLEEGEIRWNTMSFQRGDTFLWRWTALEEELLQVMLAVSVGTTFSVGRNAFSVAEVYADGRSGTGVAEVEEHFAAGLEAGERMRELTLRFRSPTTFRVGRSDYPFPSPEYIFSSLLDRLRLAGLPLTVGKEDIRAIVPTLIPVQWRGASLRVTLNGRQNVAGFTGEITYSAKELSEEERTLVGALAAFAPFTGVGRLTAQGFGVTEVEFA